MINMVKLPTKKSNLFLRVAKGHFATTHECMGYEVTSIFDPASLPDYASFDSRDCPLCKAGQHIDALVNSFGYSAL